MLISCIAFYNSEKDPIPAPALENGNSNVQYQIVIDENVASRDKSLDSWVEEPLLDNPEVYNCSEC